jgi:hypothetical protein
VVVLVTDLSGVGDLEPVISKLALAAIKRTRVLFAVPFTPDYVSPPPGAVGNLVFDSFAYGEQADRGRIARELAAAGAATLFVAPGESARRVLSLASHAPRRR